MRAAKKVLVRCWDRLEGDGVEVGAVEAGVMIETPAAVCVPELIREAAFFSIGTNDLVQYTMAADRGNERLRRYLRGADHPSVLKLMGEVCGAAWEAGIWVGVCGEAAGDPAMIPKLVELGVTELSMSAPAIPRAKKILSEL